MKRYVQIGLLPVLRVPQCQEFQGSQYILPRRGLIRGPGIQPALQELFASPEVWLRLLLESVPDLLEELIQILPGGSKLEKMRSDYAELSALFGDENAGLKGAQEIQKLIKA